MVYSHAYRRPDALPGLSVLVVGSASSGADISRDIATVARRVLWSGRAFEAAGLGGVLQTGPTWRHSVPPATSHSWTARFDSVLLATGFEFSFPFLSAPLPSSLGLSDSCIKKLHKHMHDPAFPSLHFIGLTWCVVPFPLCERRAHANCRRRRGWARRAGQAPDELHAAAACARTHHGGAIR